MASLSICLYSVIEVNLPLGFLQKYMITQNRKMTKNGASLLEELITERAGWSAEKNICFIEVDVKVHIKKSRCC